MAKHRTTIIDELALLDESHTKPKTNRSRTSTTVRSSRRNALKENENVQQKKVCLNDEYDETDEDNMVQDTKQEETEYNEDDGDTNRDMQLSDENDPELDEAAKKEEEETDDSDSIGSLSDKLDDILKSINDLKGSLNDDNDNEETETETEEEPEEATNDVDSSNGEEEDSFKKEDFSPLFSKEKNLSEEFKSKANVVFNAVLQEKMNHMVVKLANKAERTANKKVKSLLETTVEDVNDYFEYITEQWMEENQIAIEQGIRNNLIENVLYKFKKALAESYIELPEEDLVIMEELEHKTHTLKNRLDEVLTENIKLKKTLIESKKNDVINSICEDLSSTETEKFKNLSKNVEFDNPRQFKSELVALKEAVIRRNQNSSSSTRRIGNSTTRKPTTSLMTESAEQSSYIDINNLNPTKRFIDVDVQRVEHSKINEYTQHLGRLNQK